MFNGTSHRFVSNFSTHKVRSLVGEELFKQSVQTPSRFLIWLLKQLDVDGGIANLRHKLKFLINNFELDIPYNPLSS